MKTCNKLNVLCNCVSLQVVKIFAVSRREVLKLNLKLKVEIASRKTR